MAGGHPSAEYCEHLIRFIGNAMLDPHRYFEQKMLGELALSDDEAQRRELLQRLVSWIETGILDPAQRARLDGQLASADLPTTLLAVTCPDAAWALIIGDRSADALACLRRLSAPGSSAPETDQALVSKWLAATSSGGG